MKNFLIFGFLSLCACTEAPRSLLVELPRDFATPTVDMAPLGAPMLTAITPKIIPSSGGTQITVTGGPFSSGTKFVIAGDVADVMSVSSTQAILIAPARLPVGPVQLVVRNPDGMSVTSSNMKGSMTALSVSATRINFQQTAYPTQANQPRGAAFGDINGDNNVDAVVTHISQGIYTIFLGNGLGGFSPLSPTATFGTIGGQGANNTTRLLDLNGDGRLDMLMGTTSNQIHYYLGNGTGLLNQTAQSNYGASGNVVAQTVADINGDNLPDIITANVNASNIGLFLNSNNNANLFSSGQYMVLNPGSQPTRVQTVDIDGDKRMDLVVSLQNNAGPTLAVYFGTGQQVSPFTPSTPSTYGTNTANQAPQWFETADLNGDGKIDCVVSDFNTNSLRVFLGTGQSTNTFNNPLTPIPVGLNPMQVGIGDWNGDGKLDLLVANNGNNTNNGNTVSLLLGNGDGTFDRRQDFTSINNPWAIYPMDFNNDGLLDFAVINEKNSAFGTSPGYLTIYKNISE